MTDNVELRHGVRILMCAPDGPAIRTDRDAVDLIASTFDRDVSFVVIPVERLDEDFFVLKSGVAGAIAQKFVDYRRRLAIIGDVSRWLSSSSFRDYITETNRGRQLWILPDLDELDRRLRPRGRLQDAHIATRLPAQDLDRARAFYRDKLGLAPVEERPGGLRYEVGGSVFALFASAGRSTGEFTQFAFTVDDLDAVVAELRARGVVFEEVDVPGLKTVDGIAEVTGNYPSIGSGERAAWFRDSEGNLIGVGQPIP